MRFTPSPLPNVWVIDLDLHQDERGFLARTYCEREFALHGLNTHWPQGNLTLTKGKGYLRGLHFQAEPMPEIKLVRCAVGAVFDVVVDLRPGSPTYGRWEGFELTSHNHRQIYIPAGFAHGLQCLSDVCEVFYLMSEFYDPSLARGLRWNDPALGIRWPISRPILSERDQHLPFLAKL